MFVGWKCEYLLYQRPRAALVGGSAPLVLVVPPKSGTSPSHRITFLVVALIESVVSTMINGTAARKLAQTASTAGARYVFFLL